ncbi:MAG: Gfo/Idh/MocA family protein [Bryobacteraceae bacterium]
MNSAMNRRNFVGTAAGAFTIVPRHVLGGQGFVAPSDKLTMAHIGCGTQGTRELVQGLIQDPRVQIVAVCDPVKDGDNYLDWAKNAIRDSIRRLLEDPGYNEKVQGIRCGRDQFQDVVQRYYAKTRGLQNYKVASYADFRELLEKEKDINCVKIMTPDHLHAAISLAAMKRGLHVLVHKPLANRMNELRLIMETARQSNVATHFLAYGRGGASERIIGYIREGAIGTLREIHNWTDRPVWPQYTELPTDRPPVPEGFDWQLWLGPERDRPYHPCYTHMVFRSWYDFGGGCIADVGIYSLWPVFTALKLGPPISARAWATHTCNVVDHVANPVVNDFSFPTASTIQFEFAPTREFPSLQVFWYDGGIQPRIPELDPDPAPVPPGGMLFVGDKGKILSASGAPRLITSKGVEPLWREAETPKRSASGQTAAASGGGNDLWVNAFLGGEPSPGDFRNAGPISETVCLAAVALRAGRIKSGVRVYPAPVKLLYDSQSLKITNMSEANKYLTRDYRPGWELPA